MVNKVYKGNGYSPSDVICNIKDSKVYKGNGFNPSDVICNIKNNKVYKGNGYNPSDVICNIKDNKVYKGNGYNPSDVLIRIDGDCSECELVVVLLLYDKPTTASTPKSSKTTSTTKKTEKPVKANPFLIFAVILFFICYSVSNFISDKKEERRIKNESHIESFIQEKDYAGAEEFLIENSKYLKTTCVDLLFTEALSHNKEQIITEMLERTSRNGDVSRSKIYDKAFIAYARKGEYKKIINLFDEYGLEKKIIRNTIDEALKVKQYKTIVEVLEYVKTVEVEYLPKNFTEILDSLLKEKRFSECQKLILGTKQDLIYAKEIVRKMAENGNRSAAKKFIQSNKDYFIEKGTESFYDTLIRTAETW